MSDAEYDLAEILKSPLDPEPGETRVPPWGWMSLLFAVALIFAAASVGAALTDEASDTADLATTAVDAAPPRVPLAEPFPAGYVPIVTDVAVRAESPVAAGERTLVPMTMLLRRNADPATVARPLGGRWELRTPQGVVTSRRILYDRFRPSVFSVEFPLTESMTDAVVMVERWDPREATGSIEFAWPGGTFRNDSPLLFDLGGGATLAVSDLELGNFLGRATWQLEGSELGIVDLQVDLLDAAGNLFGSYENSGHSLDAAAGSGVTEYFWAPGFRVDQDDASTLRVTARVILGTPVPTEIEVALP